MAEPDNPVDFLRNRRAAAAAAAGNGGAAAAAASPASIPVPHQEAYETETFENPTHPATLEDMEPGDLMEGTGQAAMHQPVKPTVSGGGDGAADAMAGSVQRMLGGDLFMHRWPKPTWLFASD